MWEGLIEHGAHALPFVRLCEHLDSLTNLLISLKCVGQPIVGMRGRDAKLSCYVLVENDSLVRNRRQQFRAERQMSLSRIVKKELQNLL